LLERIEPSVDALVEHVAENSDFNIPEYGAQCGTFEVEHEGAAAEGDGDESAAPESDGEEGHSAEAVDRDASDTGCETPTDANHDGADESDADHGEDSRDDEGEENGE
jgi:hypothetical protein